MISKRVAAMLLALACLTGCMSATRLAESDIRMLPRPYAADADNGASVIGLKQALTKATPGHPVKMLTIHGIIQSKAGYSNPWQAAIAKELDLVPDPDRERQTVKLYRGYDVALTYKDLLLADDPEPSRMVSRLTRTVWRNKKGEPQLVVYELLWAPIRDDVKYRYFACFESRSAENNKKLSAEPWKCDATSAKPNNGSQALVNGIIKDELLVRGFADAVIINGAVGDILRDDMSLATCVMAFDAQAFADTKWTGPSSAAPTTLTKFEKQRCDGSQFTQMEPNRIGIRNVEYFAITHSLGSYFLFEALARHSLTSNEPNDSILWNMFDTSSVFMFANQIALLSLAEVEASCVPPGERPGQLGGAPCPNGRLQPYDPGKAGGFPMLTDFIAFNDADDDLGLELPPFLSKMIQGRMINVTVHNPAFEIPWLFRNPGDVHTSQERNPAVIDAIVNGIPKVPLVEAR